MKISFPIVLIVTVFFVATIVLAKDSEPVVSIPRISEELAKKISGERDFNLSDWDQAAEIRQFNLPGGRSCTPENTVAYLQYDGTQLLVAFLCYDKTMKGRAFQHQPNEDMTHEEAVQVVLGIEGGEARKIDMGGYEGAQGGTMMPVAHFYEYTCNAVGSTSRTYNETPLSTACFIAKTGRFPGGWFAVFHIPFASAGISEPDGHMFYFNLFRFYRTNRYGWYLPSFGTYRPLTFGKAKFLSSGQTDLRTVETQPSYPPKNDITAVPATFSANLSFYPLSRTLVAEFPPDKTECQAILCLDGTDLKVTSCLSAEKPTVLRLKIPSRISARKIVGKITVRKKDDSLSDMLRKTFTIPSTPSWYGTKAGIEYVDKKVPYPWKKPIVNGETVVLSHEKIKFEGALPENIEVKGKVLSDAPIRVRAIIEDEAVPVDDAAVIHEEPTRVLFSAESGKGIQIRTMVDYDGFMVIKMRLNGFDARKLKKLEVHVPLAKNIAKYVVLDTVQKIINLCGHGYVGNAGEFWVGNSSMGLSFSYDREVFFSEKNGRQIEIVQYPDGKAEIVLRLVNRIGQVKNADQVFQFFLLPTPTRGDFIPPMLDKMDLWFEEWSNYQGYPDLAKMPQIKQRSEKDHEKGKRLYMYFSQCLAENSPGFKEYRNDLIAPPARAMYRRAYNPGKGVPCYVCCFRGAAGDLLLDGIDRMISEGGLDGVYLDGPSVPFFCDNPAHLCSQDLPAAWEGNWDEGRILGQRRFLKRLRGLFDAKGYHFPIWDHTGGGLNFPTMSFCDFHWEGEQLARYRQGYLLEPEKFIIGYTGKPFGFRGIFLPRIYVDSTGLLQAMPWGLLHDTESRFCGEFKLQDLFFDLSRKDPTARFFPYWENQPHIKVSDGSLPVSYYLGKNEAMLVVSNLRYVGTKSVRIDVSGMFPSGDMNIVCVNDKNFAGKVGKEFTVTVPESQCRVFRITPHVLNDSKQASPANYLHGESAADFKPIKKFDVNDWTVSGKFSTGKIPAVKLPLIIGGVNTKENSAELKPRLPREFTAEFSLSHSGKFQIDIDDAVIRYILPQGWVMRKFDPFDQDGKCLAMPFCVDPSKYKTQIVLNRPIELRIVCKEDRLSVFYNGDCLLKRMLPEKIFKSHKLKFSVWDGDKLGLDVKSITPKAEDTFVENPHPIR